MNSLLMHGADALALLLLIIIPGIMLIMLMNLVSDRVQTLIIRILGVRGYLIVFGWIGTLMHELSHALMCVIFCHKIKSIKWFSIAPRGGALGQVSHTYDKGSFYQRFGCVFISIAPLLGGSVILFTAAHFIMPELLVPVNFSNSTVDFIAQAFIFIPIRMGHILFSPGQFLSLSFYLMLYILITIGSSQHMSKADLGNFFSSLPIILPSIFATGFLLSIADTLLESDLWQSVLLAVFYIYALLSIAMMASLFTVALVSLVSIFRWR